LLKKTTIDLDICLLDLRHKSFPNEKIIKCHLENSQVDRWIVEI